MLVVDGPAPYAPAKPILAAIDRHRQVRLAVIDAPTLMRMGVPDSLIPRTLQAMRLLDLVDESGRPSEAMEALRTASTAEFKNVLSDVIRHAYAPVFEVVDPTVASHESVEDAFRRFTPSGQRDRMVSLFMGLLAEAGLIAEVPRKKGGPRPSRATKRPTVPKAAPSPVAVEAPPVAANAPVRLSYSPRADGGDDYFVPLASGGSVTVNVDVNLFDLTVEDRQFISEVIDLLRAYKPPSSPPGGS
jgi:hypothetical protein